MKAPGESPAPLAKGDLEAFVALARAPVWALTIDVEPVPGKPTVWQTVPVLADWLVDGGREAVIRYVVDDDDFLRLSADDRQAALDTLRDARDLAWRIDHEAKIVKAQRLSLLPSKKSPGYRKASRAFSAVFALFGEAPFPFYGERHAWSNGLFPESLSRLRPHEEIAHHARAFLDATMRTYPAIAIDYPGFTRAMLRQISRAPKAPVQRNTKRALRTLRLTRENVSRLLYAVRLVPTLSPGLRPPA
jgi:hypothetical protein